MGCLQHREQLSLKDRFHALYYFLALFRKSEMLTSEFTEVSPLVFLDHLVDNPLE